MKLSPVLIVIAIILAFLLAIPATKGSKTQGVRLLDVFLIGPLCIYGGVLLANKHPIVALGLVIIGAATISYNGKNYIVESRKKL